MPFGKKQMPCILKYMACILKYVPYVFFDILKALFFQEKLPCFYSLSHP